MDYVKKFQVKPGVRVKLAGIDPDFTGTVKDKVAALAETEKLKKKLGELQYKLYGENKRSLLVCLQAMDAAGKDGTVRHVFGAMNPQGTRVQAFKAPSSLELSHDFLWRIHQHVPAKGEVVIFNRSHYEDVLIARVHNLVPKPVWSKRYGLICDFERNLVEKGTHILKFFLHIDEDEQLRRFGKRLEDPARRWKISEADYEERKYWPQYRKAYEDAISKTSTDVAPWFIIPANHKWFRDLAVARILVDTLESLNMKFPEPTVDIAVVGERYHAETELIRNRKVKGEK